jgi:hypothetical protein
MDNASVSFRLWKKTGPQTSWVGLYGVITKQDQKPLESIEEGIGHCEC